MKIHLARVSHARVMDSSFASLACSRFFFEPVPASPIRLVAAMSLINKGWVVFWQAR